MIEEFTADLVDFKALYNLAPCGLLTFKMDGTIINVNQTLLKWCGITDKEIVHKNITGFLDKAGVMYYELFVQPMLKMHQEVKEINLNIKTTKGVFSCLFNGIVVVDKTVVEGMLVNAIIFKIEDRKKYEKELLFKRTTIEAENLFKSNALKEVAFEQSHLARAPLANILGLIPILEQKIHRDDDVDQIIAMLQKSALKLDKQIGTIVKKANLTESISKIETVVPS